MTIESEDDSSISTTSSTPSIADSSLTFDPHDAVDFELSDDDDAEGNLSPVEKINWKLKVKGRHESTNFTGFKPTQYTSEKVKKCGRANDIFFSTLSITV